MMAPRQDVVLSFGLWTVLLRTTLCFIPSPCRQAVIKILVQGLIFNGKQSYLRQAWNILDIFIVIVGILVLALESITNPSYIIWLRAFRALR
jgi:hypothetical protein